MSPTAIQENEATTVAPFRASFYVLGDPKGQPRPRAFAFNGRARVYDPGTAEGWKAQVALAAKQWLPTEPLAGALTVAIDFHMRRPKGHFGKHGVKLSASALRHTGRPDADNLCKAVLDALTEIGFWRDDSQIVELNARKFYSLTPGAYVVITECRGVA